MAVSARGAVFAPTTRFCVAARAHVVVSDPNIAIAGHFWEDPQEVGLLSTWKIMRECIL